MGELHLGVVLPNYGTALDAEHLAAVAVAAEEAGFDSGWVSDHLMVPAEMAPVYGTITEALVSLGFLAARTRHLRLGVSALVVPQRNPLVALKQVTSLDFLSGGRVVLAVAAGWLDKEFETLESPFPQSEYTGLPKRSGQRLPARPDGHAAATRFGDLLSCVQRAVQNDGARDRLFGAVSVGTVSGP